MTDIRAAYSYEVRDWNLLAVGVVIGVALGFTLYVMALAQNWPTGLQLGIAAAALVLSLTAAVVRILTKPKRLLRIDAYSGQLLFPNLDDSRFFRLLVAGLAPLSGGAPSQPAAVAGISSTFPASSVAPAEPGAGGFAATEEGKTSHVPEVRSVLAETRPEPSVTLDPALFPAAETPASVDTWRQSPRWSVAAQEDAQARESNQGDGKDGS